MLGAGAFRLIRTEFLLIIIMVPPMSECAGSRKPPIRG